MTYPIDSDWVADYLKGRLGAVVLVDRLRAEGIAVSAVSVAEVYEGVLYGGDASEAEVVLLRFLRGVRVLAVDRRVARRFAGIRGLLRAAGQRIEDPDLFIAATAIEHDLTLVTRNRRHFGRIPDLRLYEPT